MNMPVFFGPNNKHFQEAQWLLQSKGGIEISSYDDFKTQMDAFVASPELIKERGIVAGRVVEEHTGATQKVIDACW